MTALIIIIDNDPFMRTELLISLFDAGWDVLSYAYEDINPALLKHLQPAFIVLNVTEQTGGAGWQFIQILKMDDTTAGIPILITTTVSPLAQEIQHYLLTRYIQILYQPFALDTFLQLIRKTLTLASQVGIMSLHDRAIPILVVDDSEDLREGIATVLQLEGYQVVTATNGLLALEAIYHEQHSLILLDLEMPIMGGIEFLTIYSRQLRPHSPVIVLSGKVGLRDISFPFFVVDVLSKPFEVSDLVTLAEKYTETV